MNSRNATLTVAAQRDDVFNFLANPENLRQWATDFCWDLRRDGNYWKVSTANGDLFLMICSDAYSGVIDLFLGRSADRMELFPFRVVEAAQGKETVVLLTFFQSPEISDAAYERQYAMLLRDLRILCAHFGGGRVDANHVNGAPFQTGIVTSKLIETWNFYVEHLGFKTLCECDEYVHLLHPGGVQFGIMKAESDVQLPELIVAHDGRGMWLNIEVENSDVEYFRLASQDIEIVQAPVDQPWGERSFVLKDPNGILIYISHKIENAWENSSTLAFAG